VEFDFSSGGQLYKVIRKHARPKGKRTSGQSSLDLFICNGEGYLPLSAERITQTQEKIESILHMDYETFTNSVYLRQGHADEFTRQPAGKRKEVLANILGLSIYDEYEDMAKDKAREAEQEKMQLSVGISEIEAELVLKPDYEAEMAQAENTAAELDTVVTKKEADLKIIRAEAQALESVKTQLLQLEAAVKRHNEDLQREETRQKQSRDRIADYGKLIEKQEAIESGYKELQDIRRSYEELNQQSRQISKLKERLNQYQKERDKAQSELNTRHKLIENTVQQLEDRADKLAELKLEQQKLIPQRQALEQIEADIKARREEIKQKQSELSEINAATGRLKQDISEIDEKLRLLAATGSDAHCPLCESDLSGGKIDLYRKNTRAKKDESLHSILKNGAKG
jgi:exonuclease SbcC